MKSIEWIKKINNQEYEFDKWTMFIIGLLVFTFSGIFGFIYETFFYRIDLGYFVKRGITYGPWIPIYGFGGIFISLLTHKAKKSPTILFLLACIISGIVEFTVGYFLYNIKGLRLWDYNIEIWNFGNIGGYICLRSILFFGLSGLFLIYFIIPVLKNFTSKCKNKFISFISLTLGAMFIFDIIISTLQYVT